MNEELKRHLSEATVPMDIAAKLLGICLATAYTAAKRGDFPVVKIGRKMVVPTAPLRKLLCLEEASA